jgi:hypothetical protein
MKKTFKFQLAVSLFIFAIAAAVWAMPNMMFTVTNNTSFDVGSVTVYNSNGIPTKIYVPGPGSYNANVEPSLVGAVINNQRIPKNGQVDVMLASGFGVQVTWTGNQIVVQDQSIIQGDKNPHGR